MAWKIITNSCEVCGKVFRIHPSDPKYNRGKFCSDACKYRGRTKDLAERFYQHLGDKTSSGCILWTGCINTSGYGAIRGRAKRGWRNFPAHRVAWELVNGPVPKGMMVLHNCPGGDNRICVNHEHLFLGTHGDNMADMVSKGRSLSGEKNLNAKLNDEIVREIRKARARGVTLKQLSVKYGVAVTTICKVDLRESWQHVKD